VDISLLEASSFSVASSQRSCSAGMSLSDEQKRNATRLARQKGLTCPDCGSSEPVPEDEVQVHPGSGVEIAMRCENCEGVSEVALVLSPEEAKVLGLGHALRERPEETL
jgi:hypothetical protein